MSRPYLITNLVLAVCLVTLVGCLLALPEGPETPDTETGTRPVRIPQKSDPMLIVPESTMDKGTKWYVPNWDDNPVATIPESTMSRKAKWYIPNWDENPFATIPESTMGD